ncbi:MAG: VOC family protein [Cyanobacteriota bacterium]|nr:VOC family protein [Cyanobacteriota bacterium]
MIPSGPNPAKPGETGPPLPPRLWSFGFHCADLEATTRFFQQGLGFVLAGDTIELRGGPYGALLGLPDAVIRLRRLRIGAERFELSQVVDPGAGARVGRPIPADSRANDLWFQHICLVTSAMEDALDQLQGVRPAGGADAISSAPQRLPDTNPTAAGIVAFKFRDPEGHPLELLRFPPGKGEPRWHQGRGAGPVLGIDHSAIGVADTEASRRFYAEVLGLRQASDAVNCGLEQEHLDGLAGVAVRITSHRPAAGPGMECLHYLQPADGRPMPADLGPQDGAHWQVQWRVTDLARIVERVTSAGGRLLSDGIVDLGDQAPLIGARQALRLADPDGHRLLLLEG